MTVVRFHGLLAKKFGSQIKLHLGNLNFLCSAIDSIKIGFINFIKEKEKNCQFFLISKKLNEKIIDIYPALIGSGNTFAYLFLATLFGIGGFGIIYAFGWHKSPTFWKIIGYTLQVVGFVLSFWNPLIGFAISTLGGIAVGYGNYLEAMQALEKMRAKQQKLSGGGDARIVDVYGKAYIFNRTINLATQGSQISIVYGKLKLGSKLISINVKSTNSNLAFDGEPWNSNEAAEIYG